MPYYMYFPFDTNNRPVYDLTFLYQTYCISMNAVLLTGFDGVLNYILFKKKSKLIFKKIPDYCWTNDYELMSFKDIKSSPAKYQEKSNL